MSNKYLQIFTNIYKYLAHSSQFLSLYWITVYLHSSFWSVNIIIVASSLEDGEVDEESDDDPEKTDKVAEDNLDKRKMNIALGFLDFLEQDATRLREIMEESDATLDAVLEDLHCEAKVFQMSAHKYQDQESGTKL